MPGIEVKMGSYVERGRGPQLAQDRYNSEDSLEDNQSSTSSLESRQSVDSRQQDFKREHEFIPTRSSGILASKPAYNPGQFTRVNSNPLLISAQKQLLQVEEVRKKKLEVKVGDETPEWQSNLDNWKVRRRKQSEEALTRVSEIRRIEGMDFENGSSGRKMSIGRKISMQYGNDDVIDLDDLCELPEINQEEVVNGEKDEDDVKSSQSASLAEKENSQKRGMVADSRIEKEPLQERRMGTNSRMEKEPSQEREMGANSSSLEENKKENFAERRERGNPYQSAIEGYKSFANNQSKSFSVSRRDEWVIKEETKEGTTEVSFKEESKESFQEDDTPLSSVSSLSPSPQGRGVPSPPKEPSAALDDSTTSKDEEWEKKIESFVQPTRKSSTELSDKMRLKLASFQDNTTTRSENVTRVIHPDNTFRDKLKAFKNIETSSNSMGRRESDPQLSRRESEPQLGRTLGVLGNHTQPAGAPTNHTQPYRSTSSSALMNTIQNNRFFQQNSLSSEESNDAGLLEDALEESFEKLLEDKTKPVFSAEDFIPSTERLAPPSEKPPPLPPVPPPGLDEESLREDDLAKQEREIIESLEREENEKQKKFELKASSPVKVPTPPPPSSFSFQTKPSSPTKSTGSSHQSQYSATQYNQLESIIHSQSQYTSQHSQSQATKQHSQTSQFSQTKPAPPGAILEKNGARIHHSRSSSSIDDGYLAGNVGKVEASFDARTAAPALPGLSKMGPNVDLDLQGRKKSDGNKDYSKHWLIQEAEQRRLHEVNQKLSMETKVEKLENINNNSSHQTNAASHQTNVATYQFNSQNGYPVKGEDENGYHGAVSENIYANVDPNHINYTRHNSGYVAPMPGMQRPGGKDGVSAAGPEVGAAGPGPVVPPRVQDPQDRVLSVSGKKKCSACISELGRGAAMIIESLRLFYHIRCFKCCVCSVQLGNGEQGTDVRVRNNRLHCQNCYSNDQGLKFSKV